jgi:hypothetical protein
VGTQGYPCLTASDLALEHGEVALRLPDVEIDAVGLCGRRCCALLRL